MKSNRVHLVTGAIQLVFVIGVVGAALALSASLKPDAPAGRPAVASAPVRVSVIKPEASPFNQKVSLNGVVRARTTTDVIPQVAGRVVQVSPSFRPGGVVGRGDILFVIDPSDYELAVERTLAEIEVARSDLARLEAEAAAERAVWNNRHPDRAIPDLIARIPQIAAAKARIHSGEAARGFAELELNRTTVRAAFDARVLETRLDVGQVVGGNAAVGKVFSLSSLEVEAPVSADELSRIMPLDGRAAVITSQFAGHSVIAGRIARTAAALDERTRLGALYIDGEDIASLAVGEFVTVTIEGTTVDTAYRVPPGALTSRDQLWVVDDGRLAERRVDVLGFQEETVIVGAFDAADGVVAIPPADARIGLTVATGAPDRIAAMQDLSRAAP